MKFSDIKKGQAFFDEDCGEYMMKIGDELAVFTTGGDYFEGEIVDFPNDNAVIEIVGSMNR